ALAVAMFAKRPHRRLHRFMHSSGARPHLPSFPPRRSSDLSGRLADAGQIKAEHQASANRHAGLDEITAIDIENLAHLMPPAAFIDRKSTRLNSSHLGISYAVFCLKKKKKNTHSTIDHCQQI